MIRTPMIRAASFLTLILPAALLFAEPPPDVYISEFMAANDRTWCSSNGDDPDWIEIHNAGEEVVDLAGWSLTDQPGPDGRRWQFPQREEVKLQPGAYLLVFASNAPDSDPQELHTNFRLCQNGESVALLEPDGSVHDGLRFPGQDRGQSFVRIDRDRIELSDTPTPGKSNDSGPMESNCVSPWRSENRRQPPCS